MTEDLDLQEMRGEIRFPEKLKVGINHDLLKEIFNILSEINEAREGDIWSPAKADHEQKVIFSTTIQGINYTLLCSRVEPENIKADCTTLSPREEEIVRLVSRGMSNKTIAAILEISPWTVSTYIRRIFSKLNVNSRVEMVAIATKSGFFDTSNTPEFQQSSSIELQKLIKQLTV